MDQERQRLLALIEAAFHSVELGNGVSLHETIVLDDFGSLEERRAARATDEKHDWRHLINDLELARISGVGGLAFYDAEGLRFHLPAYLSLAIIGVDKAYVKLERKGIQCSQGTIESLIFTLTDFSDYNIERLALLNTHQRQCVWEVLCFLRSEWEYLQVDEPVVAYWHSDRMRTLAGGEHF